MLEGCKVVDFFPYFNLTGVELLELRYNLLKDIVDKFVVCESNKTQSGIPLNYTLEQTIEKLNFDRDKFLILNLDIPKNCYLPVKDIDKINCYENNSYNLDSVLARTRERLQKDSLLKVLHNFDDKTIFIVSDSDEIVNPKHLPFIVKTVTANLDFIIKVPLVHLEGRADLRVYNRYNNAPKQWDRGMFICTKKHLLKATPTEIRSNVGSPFDVRYIVHDNTRVEDLGWHFSWMGNSQYRKIKRQSFTHYADSFSFLDNESYNSKNVIEIVENLSLQEGDIPPSGDKNEILKKYDINLLPEEIFSLKNVKDFLLS
jgi:hypothetical protein